MRILCEDNLENKVAKSEKISIPCTTHKIGSNIRPKESKPPIVDQQCVVYLFKCDLCDVDYVGYTYRHLYQRQNIRDLWENVIDWENVRGQHARKSTDIS